MGRRSLKNERRAQILEAFERCVADHGLAGATLERVAAYAGLGRPAIRHDVGNRDALVAAALEGIAQRHRASFRALVDALPERGRVDTMLAYLFTGAFSAPADEEDAVVDELFALRHRDGRAAELLTNTYRTLERAIVGELTAEHPSAPRARCRAVAYELMALSFGHSTLGGLGLGRRLGPALLDHANALVATLSSESHPSPPRRRTTGAKEHS